jgi:hypothetical protein
MVDLAVDLTRILLDALQSNKLQDDGEGRAQAW